MSFCSHSIWGIYSHDHSVVQQRVRSTVFTVGGHLPSYYSNAVEEERVDFGGHLVSITLSLGLSIPALSWFHSHSKPFLPSLLC